jgi:oligopeptide/dipeptide ABC transporter ATP-binding protein
MILDVRDLTVEFPTSRGAIRAVDGASFSLARGEVLGLVGESGSGKSMTLRAIVGLVPKPGRFAGGSVTFDGKEIGGAEPGTLRRVRGREIALVFQEPMTALNPVMRVGDQIAEGPIVRLGYSRRNGARRAVELMELVGIPDARRRARAYPHEFSGGMRQRVMIALALAADPKVILCDEPTTALDVTVQDQILKLLLSLRDSVGLSILLVTHDLAVVAETCEAVAVMYAGQIVETGRVADVFRSPLHPYTLALLRSVPQFEHGRAPLLAIGGSPPSFAALPPGCRFHPRCMFASEECRSGEFPLRSHGEARASACIHAEAAVESARERPVLRDV